MSREVFLTAVSVVAVCVGLFAAAAPRHLLHSKGVAPNPAAALWVREVGVLILATGVTTFLVRDHPDSATLRAVLAGNALLQLALLPVEVVGYARGTITKFVGIVPNTALHALLTAGFTYYAVTMP